RGHVGLARIAVELQILIVAADGESTTGSVGNVAGEGIPADEQVVGIDDDPDRAAFPNHAAGWAALGVADGDVVLEGVAGDPATVVVAVERHAAAARRGVQPDRVVLDRRLRVLPDEDRAAGVVVTGVVEPGDGEPLNRDRADVREYADPRTGRVRRGERLHQRTARGARPRPNPLIHERVVDPIRRRVGIAPRLASRLRAGVGSASAISVGAG